MLARTSALPALLFASLAAAQLTAPSCRAGWEWASNSLGQSPCEVAAYIAGVCNSGQFSVPPLSPGHFYSGPNGPDNGDICKCNTVEYSLLSACVGCQLGQWIPWSQWSFNCTSVASDGVLPVPIPGGTKVPQWAYSGVTGSDNFNNLTAQSTGDSPESTATGGPSTIGPSQTSGGGSAAPTQSGLPENGSGGGSTHHSSHAGAIAGGVVGGVVGAALLGLAAWWFWRRRRAAHVPPSATYTGDSGPVMGQTPGAYDTAPWSQETGDTPRRYYDPSDPSTYPSASPTSPTIYTTNQPGSDSINSLHANRNQYRGLPEV